MNERIPELHALAQRFVDAIPYDMAEEVVLRARPGCRAGGLEGLDTWGEQSTPGLLTLVRPSASSTR